MPTYIKIVLRFFDSGKNSTFAENFREAGGMNIQQGSHRKYAMQKWRKSALLILN